MTYINFYLMQGTETALLDRIVQRAEDLVMGLLKAWMPIEAKVYFL
jgi:hypothetical protein